MQTTCVASQPPAEHDALVGLIIGGGTTLGLMALWLLVVHRRFERACRGWGV